MQFLVLTQCWQLQDSHRHMFWVNPRDEKLEGVTLGNHSPSQHFNPRRLESSEYIRSFGWSHQVKGMQTSGPNHSESLGQCQLGSQLRRELMQYSSNALVGRCFKSFLSCKVVFVEWWNNLQFQNVHDSWLRSIVRRNSRVTWLLQCLVTVVRDGLIECFLVAFGWSLVAVHSHTFLRRQITLSSRNQVSVFH